jgi:hypothetical protein
VRTADDRLRNTVLGDHWLSHNDGIVKYADYMCWYVVELALCWKDINRRDVDFSRVQVLLLLIAKSGIIVNASLKALATYFTEFINWASHFTEKEDNKHFMWPLNRISSIGSFWLF